MKKYKMWNRYGKQPEDMRFTVVRFSCGTTMLYPVSIAPHGIKHNGTRPIEVILPYEHQDMIQYWIYVVHPVIGKVLIL